MAQYDFYPHREGQGYWLDCQTELMDNYETRFVVPLLPFDLVPRPVRRLNPIFEINGEQYTMATQYAGSIAASELKEKAGYLAKKHYEIVRALDFLISGI